MTSRRSCWRSRSTCRGCRNPDDSLSRGRSSGAELLEHLYRNRQHDRRRAITDDILQRSEIAKLHRLGASGQDLTGLREPLSGLVFAFRIDDLCSPDTFGFRLPGDRPHHRFVDIDLLDLNNRYLDAPSVGLLVECPADVGIELLALSQHLIQDVLPEDGSQRCLRQLTGGLLKPLDLDDRLLRIDDAEG